MRNDKKRDRTPNKKLPPKKRTYHREAQRPRLQFQEEDHELVRVSAATTTKAELCQIFKIDLKTFNLHFGEDFDVGRAYANVRVNKTLFLKAVGHPGQYDERRRKWISRPISPDLNAIIHWDRTRGGNSETVKMQHMGKDGKDLPAFATVFLPPNGRETGAKGDPAFALVQQEASAKAEGKRVKPNGHDKPNGHGH